MKATEGPVRLACHASTYPLMTVRSCRSLHARTVADVVVRPYGSQALRATGRVSPGEGTLTSQGRQRFREKHFRSRNPKNKEESVRSSNDLELTVG
jgi:hypothetical protein